MIFESSTLLCLPKKQGNFKLADFGMEFDMRPCDGLRLRKGTACITVRKNPIRLVKHPDSLWATSVVCSRSVAKTFPASFLRVTQDQISSIKSFFSRSICRLCPSLSCMFPFIQQLELTWTFRSVRWTFFWSWDEKQWMFLSVHLVQFKKKYIFFHNMEHALFVARRDRLQRNHEVSLMSLWQRNDHSMSYIPEYSQYINVASCC